ncbi:hypothetical protein CRYUN_Cryun15aG0018500 [Craigia yunnanensis]
MEMTTREIPLKEILGDEVKEYSTMPSKECEPTPIEERKITDETSEKDQAPDEHSETPVSQATDETLMQKEDNPTLDVPKAESEDTGQESGHDVKEHLPDEPYVHAEKESGCSSVSEVTNVSNGEEPRELENESDACKAKALQDEQSTDIGLEREKVEDGKPLDEATDVGETSGTCNDSEKATQEEENLAKNLAKPESLKEDNENVELALSGFEEKPISNSEPVVEDQSQETFPEPSKSQADETSTDVQNQETEKQITEELEYKLDNEDYANREQNANEVTKAVILSEEVDKEVEKADDSEDIKEHVIEEESSTNELHPESKGDETTNETLSVEDYTSVSTECLNKEDSNKQIEARKPEVEDHLTKDREASLVIKESESVQGKDKESEEKIEDIVDESKLCQDKSDIEAVTKVRADTNLNNTEVDEDVVDTSNINSKSTEGDANKETKEQQLEETPSDLAPPVPTNENDEVEKQSLNVGIVDKDEAEVIKRDPGAVYLSKDQIDEAEKSLTVEKLDQLPNKDLELVDTKSEASKTSNADELGKNELASDGDHVSADKGIEQDAETKKSLTAEELEANEVEETKEKPEEQLQTPTPTLPSEDEEIRTPNSIEKIEEEIQKDAGIVKLESLEDSSDTNTKEEVCLQKEEQRQPKAVSEEETVVDQGLQKKEPEKQIQTTSSTFPSEEREDAAGAISEEIDVVTRDGITGGRNYKHGREEDRRREINEAEIPEDEISEESSDAKRTAEICLEKEEFQEFEDAKKDETAAAQAIQVEEPKEQSLTSALPSENIKQGTTANEEEEEKVKEVEMLEKEICLEKERPQEPETIVAHASITEESLEIETIGTVEKLDQGKRKEAENLEDEICEDSSARQTEDKCLQKEEPNELHAVPKEGITSELEHETKKTEDEETIKDEISEDSSDARTMEEICSQKERSIELEAVVEDEMTAGHTLTVKKSEEKVQNPTSALPSKEEEGGNRSATEKIERFRIPTEICSEKDETRGGQAVLEGETIASQVIAQESEEKKIEEAELEDDIIPQSECERELQEDDSPEKIPEQTREIEQASNIKMETREKVFDNELLTESKDAAIKEKLVKARDETAAEEISVIDDEEVTETSYSTSHSEELTKDGSGEDELKDKLIEDKKNEALETICQNEELLVEAQKSTENNIIEKHIVCEDKTVEDPGQASVARIETATVTEEESSIELSQEEGTKDLAEGNQIIDVIRQPGERTSIASDKQIPRELDPIENTEIKSSIGKEHAPIDLQDRVAESSQKAEVAYVKEIYPKEAEFDPGGEKVTDNSGEDITKESTSVEDSTKVSSSDHVESSTKEILQVTQDMIEERKAKDETGAAQILLVKKPEEQYPAPTSRLPPKEGERGVSEQVDAIEEKEVEILHKDSSDTKTGEEICLEKEENKELKAVVEQENIAVQAPPTELSVETLKDSANNNVEKEIVAEEETVKDLEQASVGMKEATILREEIPGEADPIESWTTSSISKEHFPTEQQDRALETSNKAEVGDLEPGNAQEICSEAGVDHGEEQKTDNSSVEITQEPASADSAKLSLFDLLQRSTREKMQVSEHVIEERDLTVSKEEPHVEEAETIQVKEAKTDEEKEEGEEEDDHNKTDSGSDAPVMVEAPRDTDTKPHKKSHNTLSGVGTKVKHSISKVKKAITGKSSHSKESKSPKGIKIYPPLSILRCFIRVCFRSNIF